MGVREKKDQTLGEVKEKTPSEDEASPHSREKTSQL